MNLDNVEYYKDIDPKNLMKVVEDFPEQCEKALEISSGFTMESGKFNNVAVFGMGGSGIGGELVQAIMSNRLSVAMVFFHHYDVPEFIGPGSLAIMVSYSGNTEEVLMSYDKAFSRGARVVVISSGGKLMEKAKKDNIPYIKVIPGYQPRTALGFLLFPIIYVLKHTFSIAHIEEEIMDTITGLKKLRDVLKRDVPVNLNHAKKLAEKLLNTVPLIYSSAFYLDPVAKRWKTQINENAKLLAYYDFFPELCHNTICGWDHRGVSNSSVIILRGRKEDSSIIKRVEFLKEIISKRGAVIEEINFNTKTDMEEIMKVLYLGDFVSMYLAFLREVDPSDIDLIIKLKDRLAV